MGANGTGVWCCIGAGLRPGLARSRQSWEVGKRGRQGFQAASSSRGVRAFLPRAHPLFPSKPHSFLVFSPSSSSLPFSFCGLLSFQVFLSAVRFLRAPYVLRPPVSNTASAWSAAARRGFRAPRADRAGKPRGLARGKTLRILRRAPELLRLPRVTAQRAVAAGHLPDLEERDCLLYWSSTRMQTTPGSLFSAGDHD